jgi:hypothetical protein
MNASDDSALTLDEFEAAGWRKILEDAPEKTCIGYYQQFQKNLIEAETAKDPRRARIYRLFTSVCLLMLDPRSVDQPFGARASGRGWRTAIPEDFTMSEIGLFHELARSIGDAEMRARLADLAWLLSRHRGAAELAIEGYLESATKLEDPKKPPFNSAHRLERALRLSMQLGNEKLMAKVIEHIVASLDKYRAEYAMRLVSEYLRILAEFRLGDATKNIDFADEYAAKAESVNDFETAADFWRLKAKWIDSKLPEHRTALIAAAETYVKLADKLEGGAPPNYLVIEAQIERAIQAHRAISGQKSRVDELHQRLLSIQRAAAGQMPRVEVATIDISQSIERALSHVRGRSFFEALVAIAMLVRPIEPATLREHAIENEKYAPIASGLARVFKNASGRTVGKSPSRFSEDLDDGEAALRQAMRFELGMHRDMTGALIAAARAQIVLEHPAVLRYWAPMLQNNPFVPPGREDMFAQGLQAGLMGNLLVATHLLIPQFENSVRELLYRFNIASSKYDKNGIQNEKDTQELLFTPEFKEIFGPAITFDLQSLLVIHAGPNLRHGTAHGLRSAEQFSTYDALYFWCRVLGFCIPEVLIYLINDAAAKRVAEQKGAAQTGG